MPYKFICHPASRRRHHRRVFSPFTCNCWMWNAYNAEVYYCQKPHRPPLHLPPFPHFYRTYFFAEAALFLGRFCETLCAHVGCGCTSISNINYLILCQLKDLNSVCDLGRRRGFALIASCWLFTKLILTEIKIVRTLARRELSCCSTCSKVECWWILA